MHLFILQLAQYYGIDMDYYLQGYYFLAICHSEKHIVIMRGEWLLKFWIFVISYVLSMRAWVSYFKSQFIICEMV